MYLPKYESTPICVTLNDGTMQKLGYHLISDVFYNTLTPESQALYRVATDQELIDMGVTPPAPDLCDQGSFADLAALNTGVPIPANCYTAYLTDTAGIAGGISGRSGRAYWDVTTSQWVVYDLSPECCPAENVPADATGHTIATGATVQDQLDELDAAIAGFSPTDAKNRGTFADLTALTTAITTPVEGDTAVLSDGGTVSGGTSGKSAIVYYNGTAWVFQEDFEYTIGDASQSQKGIVEFADSTEIVAGTATNRVISVADLAVATFKMLGNFATLSALNTAFPTPKTGDSARITDPTGISGVANYERTPFFVRYNGTAWERVAAMPRYWQYHGVVRFNPTTQLWELLSDSDHYPIGIASISSTTSTNGFTINLSNPSSSTGRKISTCIIGNDEMMAAKGITGGASVGYTIVQVHVTASGYSLRMNGTSGVMNTDDLYPDDLTVTWDSTNKEMLISSPSANGLGRQTGANDHAISVLAGKGANWQSARLVAGWTSHSECKIEFLDHTGTAVTPTGQWSFSRAAKFTPANSVLARENGLPSTANFWVYGLMEETAW